MARTVSGRDACLRQRRLQVVELLLVDGRHFEHEFLKLRQFLEATVTARVFQIVEPQRSQIRKLLELLKSCDREVAAASSERASAAPQVQTGQRLDLGEMPECLIGERAGSQFQMIELGQSLEMSDAIIGDLFPAQ